MRKVKNISNSRVMVGYTPVLPGEHVPAHAFDGPHAADIEHFLGLGVLAEGKAAAAYVAPETEAPAAEDEEAVPETAVADPEAAIDDAQGKKGKKKG